MNLQLLRVIKDPNYVIGRLFVDGVSFCDTLEDPLRSVKIKNKTCIWPGTYEIIINQSQRFKRLMPSLKNVPLFEGIRIHSGNTALVPTDAY